MSEMIFVTKAYLILANSWPPLKIKIVYMYNYLAPVETIPHSFVIATHNNIMTNKPDLRNNKRIRCDAFGKKSRKVLQAHM